MPATVAAPATAILTAGDPAWDEARQAWNLALDQRPAAIACPASAQEVVAAVRYARRRGLRVAAQATGHGAASLGPLCDTLLVKTGAMRAVRVDPATMTARAEAGALWQDVTEAAAQHGLAALAGSSPDVGVVGYTIGGGMSWLGRAYGLSANNVEAIELVTADGELRRADAAHETDLFWALRGGGGSFGVVTAVELRLLPITEVSAGLLWWPIDAAPDVLHAWRELTGSGLPEEFTTSARLMRFPQLAQIPAPLRGGAFTVIDVVHLGTQAEADQILAPLRKLGPATDTVRVIPARELGHLHMDPGQPTPGAGDGLMLADLPAAGINEILRLAGPAARTPLLAVELRLAGGQMRRAQPGSGALAAVDAEYVLFSVGLVTSADAAATVTAHVRAVQSAMAPWGARQMYLNVAETSRAPAAFWTPQAYERLRRIKAAVDPGNRIRSNHPVPPAAQR